MHETLLFRAGEAALYANKPKKAIEYMDKLLKENPKTANFFRAKIVQAKARRALTPPDMTGAANDLAEVRTYTQDDYVANEAIVELAITMMAAGDEASVRKGLGQLGQIILIVDGRPKLLADETRKENLPFIEHAIFLAAKSYGLIGDAASQALMVKEYRQRFPDGQYKDEIGALPTAKTAPAPAPGK